MSKLHIDDLRCEANLMPQLSVFLTDLGWFGLLGAGKKVTRLTIGHTTSDEVRRAVWGGHLEQNQGDLVKECDWSAALRVRLERYAQGHTEDFRDVEIVLPAVTDFQRRVVQATRQIGYGTTISYGKLAERAGAPRAARAVGSVMAANRFPILVPCHRVVASGGRLGGFSASQGVSLKERMLELEGVDQFT